MDGQRETAIPSTGRARVLVVDDQKALRNLLSLYLQREGFEPQAGAPAAPAPRASAYRKLRLSDQFYAEGAYFGDFNRDGKLELIRTPTPVSVADTATPVPSITPAPTLNVFATSTPRR